MAIAFTGNAGDFLKIGVAAAGKGDLAAVREILEQRPHWLNRVGSHGRTMLWEAAYRGRLDVVRELAERGADIEARGCHYTPHLIEITPLCVARLRKRAAVAEFLVESGACYEIHTAAYLGDVDSVVEMLDQEPTLLDEPVDQAEMARSGLPVDFVRQPDPEATPLAHAVAGNRIDVARLLIDRGAAVRPFSGSLLLRASHRDNLELFSLLLDSGADGSQAPETGDPEWISVTRKYGGTPRPVAETASDELVTSAVEIVAETSMRFGAC